MLKSKRLSTRYRPIVDIIFTIATVLLCCFLSLVRLPGMEIFNIGPDWLLIWLVSWSLNRSVLDSLVAGAVLGAILDGLTSVYPSHIAVFTLIGYLVSRPNYSRYLKDEMIAVVLLVFVMSLLAEGAIALQYYLQGHRSPEELWSDYQKIALTSALLSSLWTPALYYPLSLRWKGSR